ncbi:aminotransferase class IV [Desulfoferrobacter suflitae]|uniref:aminotransferase class IV n=1 Tax=Desulfoferrobacter suflitae TaxID=2865782 RepID=UPI0021649E61|nr:aminotransferase class IV [Desulfoferrobacter suflitae]MCK8603399.1 aminotransferase class IV [Desulfoferrobacter suflitae]
MTCEPVNAGQVVWLNGRFVSVREAAISPLDRGFLYGDGVFETIRCQNGRILYLQDHLERMFDSLETLRIAPLPQLNWQQLAGELLIENGLSDTVASLKIIVTRGTCQGFGLPACESPTVCLMVRPYHLPASQVYRRGWRLQVALAGFAPPLAGHKSLNYLYFMLARQQAFDAGADEALILDAHGNVAETSAGSLLARTGGSWWTPVNAHQLPSITVRQVTNLLAGRGTVVRAREATLQDLLRAETVWVLNSLLGIMPVCRIDDHAVLNRATDEAALLSRELFSPHGV